MPDTDVGSTCVSVVVPVFNEANTLAEVIERVLLVPCVQEIILVDDGSDQPTQELITQLAKKERVIALRHETNQGKGAALRTGFAAVMGQIVVIQDADLEYAPEEISHVVAPILQGEADVVYGSRYAERKRYSGSPVRRFANWLLTGLSNRMTGLQLTDMETGHKAFTRKVVQNLQIEEDRFGVEPEITAKIAQQGYHVAEVAVSYDPRGYADGKKIGWRDGARAVWCIWRYSR